MCDSRRRSCDTRALTEGEKPLQDLLRYKALNGWPLFWLVSLPMSLFMVLETISHDMTRPEDVSEMIGYSVRWAVPILHLVLATSALCKLFPNPLTRWLMRNRKIVGLIFAVAMAWQGLFIAVMSVFYAEYYYAEVYNLANEMHGSVGYLFLAAMVATSFALGRKPINGKQWRVIHLCGLYFLWAYTMSVYWHALFYYDGPELHDYIFYVTAWSAFALRIAAWGKVRQQTALRASPEARVPAVMKRTGTAVIGIGFVLAVSGQYWGATAVNWVLEPAWSARMESWVPFWPFAIFWSLFVLGIGTWLFTAFHTEQERELPVPAPQ